MTSKYSHFKDKQIYLYRNYDEKKHQFYTGSEYHEILREQTYKVLNRPYKHPFIFVRSKSKTQEEMIDEHKKYILMIDEIKHITNGEINMYRTGTIGKTAMSLFYKYAIIDPENVEQYEFPYLKNGGGIRYAQKGYEGDAYKYDINSFYPSIMASSKVKMPICKGTLTDITTEELKQKRYAQFGVYHAEIICDNDVKFTTSKDNMYSHYEINYAKKLALDIIVLGQALIWSNDQTMTLHKIFDKYVKYLYRIKHKHEGLKTILNSLWGALCGKRGGDNNEYIMKMEDVSECKLDIVSITPMDEKFEYCRVIAKSEIKFYKTGFARMKPFLLGWGRLTMHKTFEKIGYDNVVWSHTDSVVSKIPLNKKHINQAYGLGKWKYEGLSEECYVYNKNFIDF